MKINFIIVAVAVVAILGFVYFIVKRNRKDRNELENTLNQRELKASKHSAPKI
jgi:preprotein translocase subunit YajC